jgi:hypothetical protein
MSRALLDSARAGGRYAFWPCDISVLDEDVVDRSRVHGPRQLTDAYAEIVEVTSSYEEDEALEQD